MRGWNRVQDGVQAMNEPPKKKRMPLSCLEPKPPFCIGK